MQKVINIVKEALNNKRRLSDQEMELILEYLLSYYQVIDCVKGIKLDYHREYPEIAGFDVLDASLYFNMNLLNERVFEQFSSKETDFSFFEFFILQQLIVILHEIRHLIQHNNDFGNREVLKKIILDSDIRLFDNDIYYDNYHLFPVEKDAEIFSIDEAIKIIKGCKYFDESTFKKLYTIYFYALINGYDFKLSYEGTLKKFYESVVKDINRYFAYQELGKELCTHDKMSFNLSLDKTDLRNLVLVPGLISNGFDPEIVLKKTLKRNY